MLDMSEKSRKARKPKFLQECEPRRGVLAERRSQGLLHQLARSLFLSLFSLSLSKPKKEDFSLVSAPQYFFEILHDVPFATGEST